MRGYAICAEPRSGSSHLGQILSSTKVLGWPREYFNAPSFRGSKEPDYPEDGESQLALILARGATPNGVYGVKVFSGQFDAVKADELGRAASRTLLHLSRPQGPIGAGAVASARNADQAMDSPHSGVR